jgi:transcription initiation factor TFIID subunit 15
MFSTIITNPAPEDTLQANTAFTVDLQVNNLEAGTFTDPLTTNYSTPQSLKTGNVVEHTYVTI